LSLKQEFPDFINIPHGAISDMLQFSLKGKPAMHFIFLWKVQVNEYGIITTYNELQTKFSAEVIKLDKQNIAQYIPEYFAKLIKINGLRTAFTTVLSL